MHRAAPIAVRRFASISQRHARARSHDLQARYRQPSAEETLARAGSDLERYETVATSPVAASLQAVPDPNDTPEGSRMARTLPAMRPLHDEAAKSKPARDWREIRKPLLVQGITVPSKPIAPGEEDCCMSGCVHCVYTIFAEDQQAYDEALTQALEAVKAAEVPKTEWPEEVAERDGGEGQGEVVKNVAQEMDPSLSAFLAFENKMKKK